MTTAAVAGQDLRLEGEPPPRPVRTHDLSADIKDWMGDEVCCCHTRHHGLHGHWVHEQRVQPAPIGSSGVGHLTRKDLEVAVDP